MQKFDLTQVTLFSCPSESRAVMRCLILKVFHWLSLESLVNLCRRSWGWKPHPLTKIFWGEIG